MYIPTFIRKTKKIRVNFYGHIDDLFDDIQLSLSLSFAQVIKIYNNIYYCQNMDNSTKTVAFTELPA